MAIDPQDIQAYGAWIPTAEGEHKRESNLHHHRYGR
jgi:hypothetical protein